MKKLMIAAAVAAMTAGAMADESLCTPEGPVTTKVARVYQVQMNVYTTKGVTESTAGTSAICGPGTEGGCLVKRGKDKTVFRGYIYTCADICNVQSYDACLCDVRRKAFFFDEEGDDLVRTYELKNLWRWNILNAIGVRNTDAEAMWTFGMKYDPDADEWTDTGVKIAYTGSYGSEESLTARIQTYHLVGAGYGVVKMGANGIPFFDEMSGYFAGYATAPFDFAIKPATTTTGLVSDLSCACEPAKALACDDYAALNFQAYDTVAFGNWKIKFNSNVSKAYLAGKWGPVDAVAKLFK